MPSSATDIVDMMFSRDTFTRWLGVETVLVDDGECILKMIVREEMCNGFRIAHGGITYSLADSALAFASNARGYHAVSIESSIAHIRAVKTGDVLLAHANELGRSKNTGHYEVKVRNQDGDLVAFFKGCVYIKDKVWETEKSTE